MRGHSSFLYSPCPHRQCMCFSSKHWHSLLLLMTPRCIMHKSPHEPDEVAYIIVMNTQRYSLSCSHLSCLGHYCQVWFYYTGMKWVLIYTQAKSSFQLTSAIYKNTTWLNMLSSFEKTVASHHVFTCQVSSRYLCCPQWSPLAKHLLALIV